MTHGHGRCPNLINVSRFHSAPRVPPCAASDCRIQEQLTVIPGTDTVTRHRGNYATAPTGESRAFRVARLRG